MCHKTPPSFYIVFISSLLFSLKFFTPVLTRSFSLKSKLLQISSETLWNILGDFNIAVVCMILILPFTSSSFSRSLGDRFLDPSYNLDHRHLHVPQLIQLSDQIHVFVFLFAFFKKDFHLDPVVFWPSTRPKMTFQGDAPEGSDTF